MMLDDWMPFVLCVVSLFMFFISTSVFVGLVAWIIFCASLVAVLRKIDT